MLVLDVFTDPLLCECVTKAKSEKDKEEKSPKKRKSNNDNDVRYFELVGVWDGYVEEVVVLEGWGEVGPKPVVKKPAFF